MRRPARWSRAVAPGVRTAADGAPRSAEARGTARPARLPARAGNQAVRRVTVAPAGAVQRLQREPYPWNGVVRSDGGAPLHDLPAPGSTPAQTLPAGQRVLVAGQVSTWIKVRIVTGGGGVRTGFVPHEHVDDAVAAAMAGMVGQEATWDATSPLMPDPFPSAPARDVTQADFFPTTFASWADHEKETPFPPLSRDVVLNCWEAILLAAYRAGVLTWQHIHRLYTATDSDPLLAAMTRTGTRTRYAMPVTPGQPMPRRGDLVFFNGADHVALATGEGSRVYSFWPYDVPGQLAGFRLDGVPDRVRVLEIEELATWWSDAGKPLEVDLAAAAW